MNDDDPHLEALAFEREKWEAEQRRLDREFELRERELTFKEEEARRSRWWNPLAIAILTAAIAALGSAYVSWQNNKANLDLETFKAESARIFEIVKTGDPDKAAANLRFLLDTGLIQNSKTAMSISNYLEGRKEGQGVSLPVPDVLPRQLAPRGNLSRSYLRNLDLHGADLHEVDLSYSRLSDVTLAGADLHNARLGDALLERVLLRGANLSGALLRGAMLRDVDLENALLRNTDLSGADLTGAKLDGQTQLNQACGTNTKLPPGLSLSPCPTADGPPTP